MMKLEKMHNKACLAVGLWSDAVATMENVSHAALCISTQKHFQPMVQGAISRRGPGQWRKHEVETGEDDVVGISQGRVSGRNGLGRVVVPEMSTVPPDCCVGL